MGLSGVSVWELLLVLVVLLLLFGSKRLPGIASDLGTAIRDFRRSLASPESSPPEEASNAVSAPSRETSNKHPD